MQMHTNTRGLPARQAPAYVDYRDLFSRSFAAETIGERCSNAVATVSDKCGHSVWGSYADGRGMLEYSCFDDDVLIVTSDLPRGLTGLSTQLTTDGDWLHIQFRIRGAGNESPLGHEKIKVPSGSCAIFRNPSGSHTMRDFAPEPWKAVCLYMRPRSVRNFFGISDANLANEFRWISDSGDVGFCSHQMPMEVSSRAIIQDMMSTRLDHEFRRAYVKSKALELFCTTANRIKVHREGTRGAAFGTPNLVKSAIDVMKLEIESPLTLASLARKVGTNRTRLAQIFRERTGVTVQAYWRSLRLEHARELLSNERIPVTEAAARVGYSSISSLTRAFSKEFGFLPKNAHRSSGGSIERPG